MSSINPNRLLSKRHKLSRRKRKKLFKIITTEPHVNQTIRGALMGGNMELATHLAFDTAKMAESGWKDNTRYGKA